MMTITMMFFFGWRRWVQHRYNRIFWTFWRWDHQSLFSGGTRRRWSFQISCCLLFDNQTQEQNKSFIHNNVTITGTGKSNFRQNRVLVCHNRSSISFLIIHPKIFGKRKNPLVLAETETGANVRTLWNLVNINDVKFPHTAVKWMKFSYTMIWGDIKTNFIKKL